MNAGRNLYSGVAGNALRALRDEVDFGEGDRTFFATLPRGQG